MPGLEKVAQRTENKACFLHPPLTLEWAPDLLGAGKEELRLRNLHIPGRWHHPTPWRASKRLSSLSCLWSRRERPGFLVYTLATSGESGKKGSLVMDSNWQVSVKKSEEGKKKAIWKVKNCAPPMTHSESLSSLNIHTHGDIKKVYLWKS